MSHKIKLQKGFSMGKDQVIQKKSDESLNPLLLKQMFFLKWEKTLSKQSKSC